VSETNPYAAPEVPVQQEEQAVIGFDVTLVLASRTQRFFTLLLDSLLRAGLVFCITVGFVLLFPDYGEKLERMSKLDEWMTEIFSLMLFYCFFEGIWQRSPAKWLLGLKVVNLEGDRPGWGQIVGRSLARMVPFEPLSFFGGGPYGWHDKWSGTRVICLDRLRRLQAGEGAQLEAEVGPWRSSSPRASRLAHPVGMR
jgi:uncharacterized RDD family membrane protein YckC